MDLDEYQAPIIMGSAIKAVWLTVQTQRFTLYISSCAVM